ncbi:MAG: T6SS immunity protein Tdi1 domain-containing protein, partial [Clostridia bacterium]
EFEECFGYVPLLALGGNETVDNLKKIKTKEHIEVIIEMVGIISDMKSIIM